MCMILDIPFVRGTNLMHRWCMMDKIQCDGCNFVCQNSVKTARREQKPVLCALKVKPRNKY